MKYISVVFVAATTLLATVSAIPAPSSGQVQNVDKPKFTAPISTSYKSHLGDRQSGGNFNAVEERQVDPEIEHNTAETDKRQVVDDPNAELGAHLIDLWTDPNYAGSFTFAVYSQMITRSCVDYSNLPQTWASFRIYPQNILFYCTFYAKANCAAGGKAFTISDGTNGYAIPDLAAFGGGLWNHNIRSLKCQPGTTGGTSSS